MARPEFHIFLCGQRRAEGHPRGSCAAKGSEALYNAFYQVLIQHNLSNRVALTTTGCLGPCQAGANVLIYPGSVMYSWVEPADAAIIVEQHLLGGAPYADKLTPAEIW
ncbi:(2Fe-2S) ferredoxin domain-containing protein [Pseudomonas sp. MAP12]|uniref:(2Fe-2S) ferredoxin domain-containing protein n=1 Tax=Geopseudomonas aromaticivorans TaxID=2849492 RepID=A0ABS6MWH2_9GAMM|nr:2Fe-2S ferredoxin [Pseudomonas aromaticivorans]MBV2133090.1 (2Fe-2S) ferredoxin domain-containing protein [Pseudomonas aromaticivorans]